MGRCGTNIEKSMTLEGEDSEELFRMNLMTMIIDKSITVAVRYSTTHIILVNLLLEAVNKA